MSLILSIRLLGGFFLTYGDRPVTGNITGRSQALLAYLVLHRHTPQSRVRIACQLWPESTDAQARANLRKELSCLRRALSNAEELLWVDGNTLQWSSQANSILDVAEFETAVKAAEQATEREVIQANLQQAIELYRGDLLPDRDDEWVLPERERLQQLAMRALERLVTLLEAQQDYQTALTYAQQMLRVDALNEATYGVLMRLHWLNGDRANALQVYHQCMTLLREELGVDPSLTTRKLYEQMLMEEETPNHPSLLPSVLPSSFPLTPLVGREPEWATIQQWANGILCGSRGAIAKSGAKVAQQKNTGVHNILNSYQSEVLLLLGEPGIGKTRLLEELREMAQAGNAQVLWGQGFAPEMMRPYGIWIDALRALAMSSAVSIPAELGCLLPELGQPSPTAPDQPPAGWRERSYLFDAVVQLLVQWANQKPLLVLLDDMQWMDEASSALLHYAIRLLRSLPVLFAGTARAGELEENAAILRVVQALRREQRLRTLELSPLDREQTADLIRSTKAIDRSELSLAVVNHVFIDSGGNPLFALEIARALSQDRPTPTNNVEALICDRLHQLDNAAQEFLPWAAALGRSFKPSTVAQVADYPPTKLLAAISQLERQAIIRPSSSLGQEMGYDFAHDIVRQVVYQQLSEPRRQLVHLQIAHKLHQGAPQDHTVAGDIAHHASLGGDRALAASAALSAAERCLKLFAYAEALELAQQGIQHCQFLDRQTQISLHVPLLRVCALAGVTGDRAVDLENEVHQLVNQAKSLGLKEAEAIGLETLMILQFDRSNFTGVHQQSLRAVQASQFASPATAARMLAYSGSCLAEIGRDMARAEALLLEAQSMAARVGLEICDIFSGLGCVSRHYGHYLEARSLLQQAWRLAQEQQYRWREFTYVSYLAMTELETGDPVAALPYCQEMAMVAAKIQGEGSEGAVAVALEALARYQIGQPQAEKRLNDAIATLQHLDTKRMLAYVLIGAAEVDLKCDRPELAVNRAEAALATAQAVNHPSEIALSWAILIQGLLALGEQERAKTQLELLQQNINRNELSLPAQMAIEQSSSKVTQLSHT